MENAVSAKTLPRLERAARPLFDMQFKLGCPCRTCTRKWQTFTRAYLSTKAAAQRKGAKRKGRR
jgi:hypothetical protein